MSWRGHISIVDYQHSYKCEIWNESGGFSRVITGMEMTTFEPMRGEVPPKALHISIEDRGILQAIVDACFVIGITPAAVTVDPAEIGATTRHLEDMRSIAFHKIGATKP